VFVADKKTKRKAYDEEKDIVLAEEALTDKFVARVMRYDGLETADGEEKPGEPKLVVFRTGGKGGEYTPKRIPGDAAVALEKAIAKFRKAGVFG
jgi:hypothetical protein